MTAIGLGLLVAGCSGAAPAAVDYRGDPLCASGQATSGDMTCDLAVTMHGHTYRLGCDLSQRSCDCFRDGQRVPSVSFFGGTIPMCTLEGFEFFWSDCCGTPD